MSATSDSPPVLPDDVAPPAKKARVLSEADADKEWAAAVQRRICPDPHYFKNALHANTQRHWPAIPQREGAQTSMFVCSLDTDGRDCMFTFPGTVNWTPRIFHTDDAPAECHMCQPNQHGANEFLELSINLEDSAPIPGWSEFAQDRDEFRKYASQMHVLVSEELLVPLARQMKIDADKAPKSKKAAIFGRVPGLSVDKAQALCAIVSKFENDRDAAIALARPEPGQCTFWNGLAIKKEPCAAVVYCKKNVYRGRKSEKYPWEESEIAGRQMFNIAQNKLKGVVQWPFQPGQALCRRDNVVVQVRLRVCISKTGISLRYEPSQVVRLNAAGAHEGGGAGAFNICSIDYDKLDDKE